MIFKFFKSKPKVYITGRTDGDYYKALSRFNEVAVLLRKNKFKPISALIDIDHGMTWEEEIKARISLLMQCDIICIMPDWKQSRESDIEVMVAGQLDYKIIHATDYGYGK